MTKSSKILELELAMKTALMTMVKDRAMIKKKQLLTATKQMVQKNKQRKMDKNCRIPRQTTITSF